MTERKEGGMLRWCATFDNGSRDVVFGWDMDHAAWRLARLYFGDGAKPVAWQKDEKNGTGGLYQIVSVRTGKVLAVVDICRLKKQKRNGF